VDAGRTIMDENSMSIAVLQGTANLESVYAAGTPTTIAMIVVMKDVTRLSFKDLQNQSLLNS
jgi:hypothetical protein